MIRCLIKQRTAVPAKGDTAVQRYLFFAFFLTENCPADRTRCRNNQYPSNDNQHRTASVLFRRT